MSNDEPQRSCSALLLLRAYLVSALRLESQEQRMGSFHNYALPPSRGRRNGKEPSPLPPGTALSTALLSGALKLLLCQEAERWGWGSSALRALPASPAHPAPTALLGGLPFQGYQGAISLRDGHLRPQRWALPSKELGAGDLTPWPIPEVLRGTQPARALAKARAEGFGITPQLKARLGEKDHGPHQTHSYQRNSPCSSQR